MKLFNSLTRQVEEFVPIKKGKVGMYTCGMTVYGYSHIGHGRKYVTDDVLRRLLAYDGYEVTHVQNVTDVGHLVSDADEGEDKMEKGARKMGKTVWEVADYFTKDFYDSMDLLNILRPTIVCKATEHIGEQIELVKRLIDKGFAYETPEAVYFDVSKFPRYDGLFGSQKIEDKQVAVREAVQTGEHKKGSADFVLWFKRVGKFADHAMHWDSPWGDGFPGWHIECSAMSMKYLGEAFDIHTGGEDHLPVHHPNEIAQSEAATGKPLARYWMHTTFLRVDGQKMSKSLENIYRVQDVIAKGFNPLALRYLFLTAHYRTPMNFTWSAMTAATSAYERLVEFVRGVRGKELGVSRTELSKEKLKKLADFQKRFRDAIEDDLNTPQALAVVWETVKSNIPDYDKLDQLLDWDQVLGLRLSEIQAGVDVPEAVRKMAAERQKLRGEGKFVEADAARMEIEKLGWEVKDTAVGPSFKAKSKI
jgi:cysteinyl-tRNA synthetase